MERLKLVFKKCLGIPNLILQPLRLRIIGIMTQFRHDKDLPLDYIRYATLCLLANEIKEAGILGDVAELGVYRGDFAKFINKLFPDRMLYLFDTFEGFDCKNVNIDKLNDYSDGTQDFTNTNIETVMKKMTNPNFCKAVKGFFPDSLNQVPNPGGVHNGA